MVRTQIQLTERQAEALKKMAARCGISLAEAIRRAVDQALENGLVRDEEDIRKRAMAASGKYHSGKSHISTRHDDYLAEAYGE